MGENIIFISEVISFLLSLPTPVTTITKHSGAGRRCYGCYVIARRCEKRCVWERERGGGGGRFNHTLVNIPVFFLWWTAAVKYLRCSSVDHCQRGDRFVYLIWLDLLTLSAERSGLLWGCPWFNHCRFVYLLNIPTKLKYYEVSSWRDI